MDVIQRLEPVIIEMERQKNPVVIIGHQAILRVIYGYMKNIPLEDVPKLEMPLHTPIEMIPQQDGKFEAIIHEALVKAP